VAGFWDANFGDLYEPITDVPYSHDAGVDAVVGAAMILPDGEVVDGLDLLVDGAVVTNIGYRPDGASDASIWFADSRGHMRTYRTSLGGLDEVVARGDRVQFRVHAITNYGGELEVTDLSDFIILPTVDPVYVIDADAMTLDYATHGRVNVRTWGEVTSAGAECGSSNCYDLQLAGGQSVIFRVSDFVELRDGDCVYWAGPLGVFAGDLQLDANELGWFAFFE
jgi:hypothetical protein